jgi:endonuclease III
MELIEKIRKISTLLDQEYGKKILRPSGNPLSVLIETILSQNTSDHNSHKAFRNLLSTFKDWEKLRKAPLLEIEKPIKSGGLAKIKAKRIKNILNQIYKDSSKTDLSFLKRFKTEEAIDYLNKFKGVGGKTTSCVLLFALGRAVIPVDTHILRLSKRLKLLPEKIDTKKAHEILQKTTPQNLVYSFHLNLIAHGRKICKAQNPRCGECALFDLCEAKEKIKFIKKGEVRYA